MTSNIQSQDPSSIPHSVSKISSGDILDESSSNADLSPVNLDSEELGVIIMRDGKSAFFLNRPKLINNKYIGPFIGRDSSNFNMRG